MSQTKDTSSPLNQTADDRDIFFMLTFDLLFCSVGDDGYFIQLNPAWEEALGYSLTEIKSRSFIKLIHPNDRLETFAETRKLRRGSSTIAYENRLLCQDGSYKSSSWNATPAPDQKSYYAVGRDISDSKEAKEALQDSEMRYRDLIESSHELVQSIGADAHFEYVNQAWFDTLGYTEADLPKLTLYDILPSEFHEQCNIFLSRVMAGEALRDIQVSFMAKDGSLIPVEGNANGRFRDGKFISTHAFFRDITERKRAERFATEYRQRLEKEVKIRTADLVQSEKLATLGRLSAGIAHEINNPAAATQRGAAQLREVFFQLQAAHLEIDGLDLADWQLAQLLMLGQLAKEQAELPDDLNPLDRSDREYDIETWLEDRGIEHAWKHAPVLVSLGYSADRLTEIAEDFTADQLPTMIVWISCTYTIHRLLAEIDQGAFRIAEIVKALKNYTYMDQAPSQVIDIHEGLDNTLLILQSKLKEGVAVRREYAADLPHIHAYGSELNQVWTNIIDNAIDAMAGRGELILRTHTEDEWVVVEIEDNGPGIPEENISKLFDPFFTTKPPGEGTGLGLNISHNIIVNKHKGKILVNPRPGSACFKIKLPTNLDATIA